MCANQRQHPPNPPRTTHHYPASSAPRTPAPRSTRPPRPRAPCSPDPLRRCVVRRAAAEAACSAPHSARHRRRTRTARRSPCPDGRRPTKRTRTQSSHPSRKLIRIRINLAIKSPGHASRARLSRKFRVGAGAQRVFILLTESLQTLRRAVYWSFLWAAQTCIAEHYLRPERARLFVFKQLNNNIHMFICTRCG